MSFTNPVASSNVLLQVCPLPPPLPFPSCTAPPRTLTHHHTLLPAAASCIPQARAVQSLDSQLTHMQTMKLPSRVCQEPARAVRGAASCCPRVGHTPASCPVGPEGCQVTMMTCISCPSPPQHTHHHHIHPTPPYHPTTQLQPPAPLRLGLHSPPSATQHLYVCMYASEGSAAPTQAMQEAARRPKRPTQPLADSWPPVPVMPRLHSPSRVSTRGFRMQTLLRDGPAPA
jgi:hypothetical protein